MVGIKTIKQKRPRRQKLIRPRALKQKPLRGSKARRRAGKRSVRRIKKAFPLATQPLR